MLKRRWGTLVKSSTSLSCAVMEAMELATASEEKEARAWMGEHRQQGCGYDPSPGFPFSQALTKSYRPTDISPPIVPKPLP